MLTAPQTQTLADDLTANTDPVVVAALAAGENNTLVSWYNGQASPDFYLWRTRMAVQEMREEHYDWSEVVSQLTTNELLSLRELTNQEALDPSRPTVRDAFAAIFSGPQTVNTRTSLLAAAKRTGTNAQQLFADTSGGDGQEATPATAVVESVSRHDMRDAVAIINAG
jgi:aspartokinase